MLGQTLLGSAIITRDCINLAALRQIQKWGESERQIKRKGKLNESQQDQWDQLNVGSTIEEVI